MIPLDDFPFVKQDLSGSVVNAEYLVEIQAPSETIYLATRKQVFRHILEGADIGNVYYDDLNLKISNIKEKIDLKTKKIQLSNMNFTISNYALYGDVLSDKLYTAIGAEIIVHIKTQSCETILDCLPIAHLKITRVEHDEKSVRINADDVNLEHFYLDLPSSDFILTDTHEYYKNKPVPILYGHLDSAPAIVDVDPNSGTVLYCDTSAYSSSIYDGVDVEIDGVKSWEDMFDYSTKQYTVNNDNVQIKLGDILCSVNCLPYVNASDEVSQAHNYQQYVVDHDYVLLNTEYRGITTLLEKEALWVHSTDEPLDEYPFSTTIWGLNNSDSTQEFNNSASDIKYLWRHQDPSDTWISDIFSTIAAGGTSTKNTIGAQIFTFPSLTGSDIHQTQDGVDMPSDINFSSNLTLHVYKYYNEVGFSHFLIYGYPSTFPVDDDAEYYNLNLTYTQDDHVYDETPDLSIGFPQEIMFDFASHFYNSDHATAWGKQMRFLFRKSAYFQMLCAGHTGANTDTSTQTQYKSYFNGSIEGNDFHPFKGQDRGFAYPFSTQSNQLTFYYYIDENDDVNDPDMTGENHTKVSILPAWNNLKLRRSWAQRNVFENDFFVNARGRISVPHNSVSDGGLQYKQDGQDIPTIQKITHGEMKVWHERTGTWVDDTANREYENKHLNLLHEILTNKKYRRLEAYPNYELMIFGKGYQGGRDEYMYDIEINNMFFKNGDTGHYYEYGVSHRSYYPKINGTEVTHRAGWHIKFTGKVTGAQYTDLGFNPDTHFMGNIELVYAKKYFDDDGYLRIEQTDTGHFYEEIQAFNEANKGDQSAFNSWNDHDYNGVNYGYTHLAWTSNNTENAKELIQNPAAVIEDLLRTEMRVTTISDEKYKNSFNQSSKINLAFSINEQKNSKDLIENICRQSNLMFRYRPRDKMAILDVMQPAYGAGNVDKLINTKRILSYKYTKSKIEDLCIGGCRVKWGYDYSKEELMNTTEDVAVSPSLLPHYKAAYGIQDETNYQLEVEAPYINDKASALVLRDFLFNFYKNQHLIVKFSLPIQDGIELEVGDIVWFDDNINGLKPYGEDITSIHQKIDQDVYPYFIVTSVSKSISKVDLEVFQLHFIFEGEIEPGDAPTAVATASPSVVELGAEVMFDGGGSYAEGGAEIATYEWSIVDNESDYTLNDLNITEADLSLDSFTFTAPNNMNGVMEFRLRVTDSLQMSSGYAYATVQLGDGDTNSNIAYDPFCVIDCNRSDGNYGENAFLWMDTGQSDWGHNASDFKSIEYRTDYGGSAYNNGFSNNGGFLTKYIHIESDEYTHFEFEDEYLLSQMSTLGGFGGKGHIRIQIPYQIGDNDELHIQARVMNTSNVWSDWSDAVVIQLFSGEPGGDGVPRPSRVALKPAHNKPKWIF